MSSVMFDVVLDATGPPSSSPQKVKRQLFFEAKEFIVTPIISIGAIFCWFTNNKMMSHVRNLQIEAVHNLRKVRMYLNVLSLRSTT